MEPGSEGHDVYVAQLQEVFDSCDSGGDGRLTQTELVTLCSRLQLDDQANALVEKLLGGKPNGTITFDQFKEGFVAVLSQSVEGLDATSEEEEPSTAQDLSDEQDDVSPKFVKGSKKYGRRSRPVGASSGEGATDYSDTDVSAASPRPARKERVKGGDEGPVDPEELKIPIDDVPETFEAEENKSKKGQLNQSIAEMENALDPVSEEQHLRDIWRELGVGTDGSLTLNELATVCDHIGMEEMNAEELQHLFDKLDVDSDGRVSFHEFLHGLFTHGGPSTPSATPVRPQSTPRQKLKLAVIATFEDRPQTPSFIASISGLFSTIDPEGTGYASADEIVELWEKLGVSQGHDILDYLQFEHHNKVALADLSAALEQEMRAVEEDNATYRAAVVSYQHELKFLKAVSDTAAAERDKLRQDLAEANARIGLLIKEGDERQAAGDDKRERELLSLEARYQEQLRTLQAEVDGEQEALTQQSARQRARLEHEVTRLKEDEARLREKLSQTQRELERLEHDILEMAEKCADLEKVNARQQRELEEAESMKLRLEELETSQAAIAEEQSRWQTDRVQQLETERTDLKDKNDELTIQVEELRQQLASATRRKSRGTRPRDASPAPGRTGSVLSDYQRPVLVRRSSDTVSSEEEEGSLTGSGRIRRRLPQPPSNLTLAEEETLRAEIETLKKEKEELGSQERATDREEAEQETEQRISQLTRNFSIERKDIEQSYRMEITDIEEQHVQDREKLLGHFEREKVALQEEAEADWTERLAAREEELRKTLEEEKRDLLIRAESEKNLLKQQLTEERAALRTSLEAELAVETATKIQEAEDRFKEQLEEMVSHDRHDQSLTKRVAELQLQMKLQREELELSFDQERGALREGSDQERSRLHQQYRQQITDLHNMLSGGEEALEGKLREDFDRLLDQHRAKISNDETDRMSGDLVNLNATVKQLRDEKDRLQKENDQNLEELKEKHRTELRSIQEEHEDAIRAAHNAHKQALGTSSTLHAEEVAAVRTRLERRLTNAQREHEEARVEAQKQHEQEQVALEEQLARTCEELISAQTRLEAERSDRQRVERSLREGEAQQQRHLAVLEGEKEEVERAGEASRAALHDELEAEIQARLEEDFLSQIERLKEVFSEEREQLENRICLIQSELDERATDQTSAIDATRIETLTTENLTLRRQKSDAEHRVNDINQHYRRLLEDKDSTLKHLETRIKTIESEHITNIERPVRVVTVSAPAPDNTASSSSERAILAALNRHQQLLESTKGELKSEIRGLGSVAPQPEVVRAAVVVNETSSSEREELLIVRREQENLVRELEESTARVVELETALSLAQSEHQRELRTLQADLAGKVDAADVTRLKDQLTGTQRKAEQLQAMWDQRATETNRMIKSSSESHAAALRKAETERDELSRQLTTRQEVLDEQVTRLKDQMENNSRRDILIKDLYVENANLVRSLYETEKREKEVNGRALRLEERCGLLQVIVQKVTHAALA